MRSASRENGRSTCGAQGWRFRSLRPARRLRSASSRVRRSANAVSVAPREAWRASRGVWSSSNEVALPPCEVPSASNQARPRSNAIQGASPRSKRTPRGVRSASSAIRRPSCRDARASRGVGSAPKQVGLASSLTPPRCPTERGSGARPNPPPDVVGERLTERGDPFERAAVRCRQNVLNARGHRSVEILRAN